MPNISWLRWYMELSTYKGIFTIYFRTSELVVTLVVEFFRSSEISHFFLFGLNLIKLLGAYLGA
jgi:hypothetical protein